MRRAPGQERGAGNVGRADRQNRRKHVADRVGEEGCVKGWRIVRIEDDPPADRSKEQRRQVRNERNRQPEDARSPDDQPDLLQVRIPQEQPEEENRERRDRGNLQEALPARFCFHFRRSVMLKIYTNSVFYRHDTGIGHPESARRLDAALAGVERAGQTDALIRDLDIHPDTGRIIAKTHSRDYERELDEACRAGMRLFHSLDNPISSATFAAARTAVATAIAAAEDIWDRKASRRALLLARPPGHHAERATAMGFCFFNTIACVAEW